MTGGAGYIGSVLVSSLLNKGYKVTVVDLMIYGENTLRSHPNLTILNMDIRDSAIKKVLEDIDVVFHLAGVSNDPGQGIDSKTGLEINYYATERIFSYCEELNIKKFIYPSSCSIYGEASKAVVDENSIPNPLTSYAKCKVLCEKTILKSKKSSLTKVIIRPATVYGISPRQRFDLLVNGFVNEAFNKRVIQVKGPKRIRPTVHINDLVSLYTELLDMPSTLIDGQVFNVAFENRTVRKTAEIIADLIGQDVSLNLLEGNDCRSYQVDSSKLTDIIKFKPKSTILNGAQEIINQFNSNRYTESFTNSLYHNRLRQPLYLV
ncbi:SDR family oxidoreductase [Bacillus cereus]|uniref:NAD-dependent epimerase/dehydratase family protein n=1 Tax=Bacillus cereus TaxID=1396 RepID=UPI002AC032AB|nr:SDR family oxidoreductase [Bacillus cereus]MDZ4481523.1 SDR family oxidoreductase [Bacillus cereus]MDZ4497379.1 SDR family oxidoreductase [Bacillus cereus]MDZ4519241.1 SDR family oxidoreductase [Bacillus cereus]MDZ4583425.1 SDR family oxidoreductase [Bacillus cereus]